MPETPLAKYLCCWKKLYIAQAWCPYNVIFAPILLILHSIRIYVGSFCVIYLSRLYWLCFARLTSYFTDEEFPPNEHSLGNVGGDSANSGSGKDDSNVIWVRAGDLSRANINDKSAKPKLHDTDMQLFHGKIEARDILQGALGDCWLLASMACLAEHEGAVDRLFVTREINPQGKYQVRLFDPQEQKWKIITVDDFVPCVKSSSGEGDGVFRSQETDKHGKVWPQTLYAHPHGHEIWALILEKAFAKLCGCFAAIEGGITEWGIMVMTGQPAWRYNIEGKKFNRVNLIAQQDKNDKRACGLQGTDESHDLDEFFKILRSYHRNGASLNCGGVKDAGVAKGLVQGHAFSLLQVVSVQKTALSNDFFRFVQIRNPWGTGEWTGAWSDKSDLWNQYPHVKKGLNFIERDDGAYWMQWEDFCTNWGYVGVVDMNSNIGMLQPPIFNDQERSGPLKSCLHGCMDYWLCCTGPFALFFNHHGSAKELDDGDLEGSCGVDMSGCYCRLCEKDTISVGAKGKVKPKQ